MLDQKINISLVIPLYNKEKYIVECLQSILAQTYPPSEIVIVNDCSTDNSVFVIEQFINEQKPSVQIKIAQNDVNSGPGITRNKGVEIATSDYVMFLDADDRITTDYISLIIESIKKFNPGLIVSKVIQSRTKRILPSDTVFQFGILTEPLFFHINKPLELLAIEFPFVGGNYVFNKKKLKSVHFNHERMFEDWLFCYKIILECLKQNLPIYLINKATYLYAEDDLESVSKAVVSDVSHIKVPEFYYLLEKNGHIGIRKKLCSIWMFNSVKRLNSFALKVNFILAHFKIILQNVTFNKYYWGTFFSIVLNRRKLEQLIILVKQNK